MTFSKRLPRKRRASVLVEYTLLIAGMSLASVVGIAVLGKKTADLMGVVAATIPGAHAEDNQPLAAANVFPLNTSGGAITLDATKLVASGGGIDRFADLLGQGGAALLIVDPGN